MAMRQNGATTNVNPYRKDDSLLLAEVSGRRRRREAAKAPPPAADPAEVAEQVAAEGALVLAKPPDDRLKWLQQALLPLTGSEKEVLNVIYDTVVDPQFAASFDTDVRESVRQTLSDSLPLFTPSQQRFIQFDPNFLEDEGAPPSDGEDVPREVELAVRQATVRPKRAAAPPSRPAAANLQGFLVAASAAPPAAGVTVSSGGRKSPSPGRWVTTDTGHGASLPSDWGRGLAALGPGRGGPGGSGGQSPSPERRPEKQNVILNNFLVAAMGLEPAGDSRAGRAASDQVYDSQDLGAAASGLGSEADGHLDRSRPPPPPPPASVQRVAGPRAAKVAAASTVASALANISNAAAAARAVADAAILSAQQPSSVPQESAPAFSEEQEEPERPPAAPRPPSRSGSRRSRRSRRSRSDRRRSRSGSGSRRRGRSGSRRRRRSASRRRGRSHSRERDGGHKRKSRFDEDDGSAPQERTSVVGASDQQAAEQLAAAKRMQMPVGTPGEMRLRPGDWTCPICNAHNFASKFQCFRCAKAKNPFLEGIYQMPHNVTGLMVDAAPMMMKVGDWLCHRCNAHNFASKFQCFRCGQGKNPVLSEHVQIALPHQAQIGGRSAAGLALKAAAMGHSKGGWASGAGPLGFSPAPVAVQPSAAAGGFSPGFSPAPVASKRPDPPAPPPSSGLL